MSTLMLIFILGTYSIIGFMIFQFLIALDIDSPIILVPMFILCGPITWIIGSCFLLAMLNEHIKMKRIERRKKEYNN